MQTLNILTNSGDIHTEFDDDETDSMRKYDPYNASILGNVIRNHLLLKISEGGAGRKDLKEILNPYRVYPFYHPQFLPLQLEEGQPQ